ncbi:MAG: type II toxin-antitoxin system RelE/ParE family toxin [Verrucomicrobia bacterium]|nr:type II toxin-antitoxin system RelE/ParE family toxin [Verrucomicrobiota bacterium]
MSLRRHYEVCWSRSAETDLEAVIDYIGENNPAVAPRILQELRRKVGALCVFPERGRIVPELKAQGIAVYREIIHPPWRIMYRIGAGAVYVLTVLDARRNVEDLLLERLIRTGDIETK